MSLLWPIRDPHSLFHRQDNNKSPVTEGEKESEKRETWASSIVTDLPFMNYFLFYFLFYFSSFCDPSSI